MSLFLPPNHSKNSLYYLSNQPWSAPSAPNKRIPGIDPPRPRHLSCREREIAKEKKVERIRKTQARKKQAQEKTRPAIPATAAHHANSWAIYFPWDAVSNTLKTASNLLERINPFAILLGARAEPVAETDESETAQKNFEPVSSNLNLQQLQNYFSTYCMFGKDLSQQQVQTIYLIHDPYTDDPHQILHFLHSEIAQETTLIYYPFDTPDPFHLALQEHGVSSQTIDTMQVEITQRLKKLYKKTRILCLPSACKSQATRCAMDYGR